MKNKNIFIGTIMKCTEYKEKQYILPDIGSYSTEDEIYKENAILLKTRNDLFIDIEGLTMLKILYLYNKKFKSSSREIITGEPYMFAQDNGAYKGNLFVDSNSIQPYNSDEKTKNTSLLKIKKL